MNFIYDYFTNLVDKMRFGKWQLLVMPALFCVLGLYIEISTLKSTSIPFKSLSIKNLLVPSVFFVVGFILPVSMWRRYIIRFSYNMRVLWNNDGFSFAFLLILLSLFLQAFAIWGDSGWDKVYVVELGGFYTESQLKAVGGFKNEIVILKRQITFGGMTFQVGEFVKVFFMIFVAKMLTDMKINRQIRLCNKFFLLPLFALFPIVFMTFRMPNYSMIMIYMLILFLMIFVQKMDLKLRAFLIAVLFIPVLMALSISNLDRENSLAQVHGINRVWAYFNEEGVGNEQQNEALQAMKDGGITGKGLDQGTIKHRLFGARNDFAFSILGEELGLWLMIPISIAMMGFLFACFWVAAGVRVGDEEIPRSREEKDNLLAQNIAWGISIIFALNIFFHIGVNLKLLPNTGQPLSFVSSGGANLAMNFFLMGMLVQISSLRREEWK